MVLVAFAEAGKRSKVGKLPDYRLNASSATPRPQVSLRRDGFFRCVENSGAGSAGNITSIVHTAGAFDPTAQEAAR